MSNNIPHGIQAIRRMYGNIKVVDGKIVNPAKWAERNIVLFITPQLRVMEPVKIWCNRQVESDLRAIFSEIKELEEKLNKPLIYSIDGCWVVRRQRAGVKLSTHAWGISVDVNAERNPLGGPVCQSQALARCFTRRGWEWGGDWKRKDGMHFQRATGY